MRPKWSMCVLLVVLCFVCTVVFSAKESTKLEGKWTVIAVYDGDTITVKRGQTEKKLRLLGIDTPEMSYGLILAGVDKIEKYLKDTESVSKARKLLDSRAAVVAGFGESARDFLRSRVLNKEVTVKSDKLDQYGRDLVWVELKGTDINAQMVQEGHAVAETRFPCSRLGEYTKLEIKARQAGKGMWR